MAFRIPATLAFYDHPKRMALFISTTLFAPGLTHSLALLQILPAITVFTTWPLPPSLALWLLAFYNTFYNPISDIHCPWEAYLDVNLQRNDPLHTHAHTFNLFE